MNTLIHRRTFLTGLTAALTAPAIVRAELIMPVRSIIQSEPMMRGIEYQSWPFGGLRPEEFVEGSINRGGCGLLRPASYFAKRIEFHKSMWPDLQWRPLQPIPVSQNHSDPLK